MNRFIFFLFVASGLAGCVTKVNQHNDEQHTAIARALFDAFNKHDWETMAALYADTASFLDPSQGIDYVKQTHAQTIAKYKEMESWMPDIHDEVTGIYASGDKVFVEFIASGTAPDGTKFRLPIASVLTLHDGKIVKDATYYDLIE